MIGSMPTTARPQQRYDHLTARVAATDEVTLPYVAQCLPIPKGLFMSGNRLT